ncbi:O-antigen ligase [Magnetospirillum sp. UT-4]|uniref:O-antigen ligase family protein n=1 Tax=Magnetospirillum sp. UT-4 TaxID=2681467 RepID=UPI001381CCB9|nr:O-antigen ligase family protein [Magnetospirillum sp. UT-4]CAA7612160.1 putative Lipid A core-O-antigen ligase and related enzymes [Magnetospirillum sp. UT-4]
MITKRDEVLALAFMAATLPAVAVLSPPAVVMPVGLTAVFVVALAWRRGRLVSGRCAWAVLFLAAYAAISAFWGPVPANAVVAAGKVAVAALLGIGLIHYAATLDDDGRRVVGSALTAGVAAAGLLLAVDYGASGALHGDIGGSGIKGVANRATSVLLLLALPAVLWLSERGRTALALALALGAGGAIALADNRTSLLAMVVSLAVFMTVRLAGTGALRVARVGLVVLVATAPLATVFIPDPAQSYASWGWRQPSLHHRLTIWRYVGERIAERPVLGFGMDSSRSLSGGEARLRISPPDAAAPVEEQLLPLHPHNAVLQIWLELGAVGAAALAVLLYRLVGAVSSIPAVPARATAAAVLAGGLVIACSSYGIWQSWWQATLWASAAMTVAVTRRVR